ncbi:helix-turn-helix transcriptional regulator [Variovorax sp. LjRoot175]|uniref:helix-turn-helix transcriptional regulator n=1 Tax=Variovorax sp. LjRoot175 TaxID=3342276 RepID=UPI003F50DBA6
MNGNDKICELKIQLLEREMARLRRCRALLDHEIEDCAGEICEIEKERATIDSGQPMSDARPISVGQSAWFDKLSDDAFLRLTNLVRTPSRPTEEFLLPFSASALWRMVSDGRFPKPIKLSERITAWRVRDIRSWLLRSHPSVATRRKAP